jgi:Holliday junction DNA helicase RuvB
MINIRPQKLDEFVGQEHARRILSVLIAAAKRRGEPVPHLLMSGAPGLGKTSLARIVASEMNGRLVEMVGSAVKTPTDMTHHLLQLKSNDVLFVDEVHAIPRRIEETLYPALEDGVITTVEKGFSDLMKQLNIAAGEKSTKIHRLPAFTLIGATTLMGLVSAPLRSRFRQIVELESYSLPDLQRIVGTAAAKLDFQLPNELAMEIARRARGTARTAVSYLYWVRDVVHQGDGGNATADLVTLAFAMKGIDENGLTKSDREYLRLLIESEEAVGAETLATVLNESVETVQQSIEPFLIRQGFVTRTSRGRTATEKARALLEEATT